MSPSIAYGLEVLAPRWGAILGCAIFWFLLAAHPLLIIAFLFCAVAAGCVALAGAPTYEDKPPEMGLHA